MVSTSQPYETLDQEYVNQKLAQIVQRGPCIHNHHKTKLGNKKDTKGESAFDQFVDNP